MDTKRSKELRDFGKVMATACLVFGGIFAYRSNPTCLYFYIASVLFFVPAVFFPAVLSPLERVWMAFGEKMSIVMTYLVLTLSFFLVIAPFAIILRLIGKDLLNRRIDRSAKTYWIKDLNKADQTRYYLPY